MKHSKIFEEACNAFVKSEISFEKFDKLTSPHWRLLATHLHNRWPAPGVSPEDVFQELRIAAWSFQAKYDPSRGVSPARFLTWNCADKAKKWIHVQRGAILHGSSDKAPSRFLNLSSDEDTTQAGSYELSEEVLDLLQTVKNMLSSAAVKERLSIAAFVRQGSIEGAATEIYNDPSSRLALRLSCQDAALKIVKNSLIKCLHTAA